MNRRFYILIPLLVLFCLISAVYGTKVYVEQGEIKEVPFELENTHSTKLYYTLYASGWCPWVLFPYSQILLYPNETKRARVFLIPDQSVNPGVYDIDLIAESTKDTIVKTVEVVVLKKDEKPEIKSFSFDDKKVDVSLVSPEKLKAKLEIYKGNILLESVEKNISEGKNRILWNIKLGPGEYVAKLKIYKSGDLIYEMKKKFSKEIISGIVQKKEEWNYLIVYGTKIIFENRGEQVENKVYEVLVDKARDYFFTARDYKEKIDEGNAVRYVWNFTLLPNQRYILIYSYNYSILLILVLTLIFFSALLYVVIGKEIKVKKKFANQVTKIREGKKIKICIEVINKTKHGLSEVTIIDYVQPIFELEGKFSGIRPSKITKVKEDLKLVWEIPRLEPGETRIVTYTIVPKIGVNDKYYFSIARVQYKKEGMKKIVFSNHLKTG